MTLAKQSGSLSKPDFQARDLGESFTAPQYGLGWRTQHRVKAHPPNAPIVGNWYFFRVYTLLFRSLPVIYVSANAVT